MAGRGRPRKPPGKAALEGTRVKGQPLVEIFIPEGAPFVPDHLPDDAQICAENVIKIFSKTHHLSSLDSYLLAVFASAWAWHKAAVEATQDEGFEAIVENEKGNQKPNPWFQIMREQAMLMLAVAPKLYLSPADRMTLNVGKQGSQQQKSKFDGLLGRQEPPGKVMTIPDRGGSRDDH